MVDKDVVAGQAKQVEGTVQDRVGGALGSSEDQADGKMKQAEGKIQEGFGRAKDAVHDALDKDQV